MYLSIIIPTVKAEKDLIEMISQMKNTVTHELDLIVISGDRSAAKNRNIGLDRARGEFVIMCDDDIEGFSQGWDKDLIDALERSGASIVGARLLNPDGTLQLTNYANFDLSKDFVEVRTMITACCAFKKSTLRFDENYIGSGFEDTDFCKQLGGKCFVVNSVTVIHRNENKNPFKKQNGNYFRNKWK